MFFVSILKCEHGAAEWIAVAGLLGFGLIVAGIYTTDFSTLAIESEARHDLQRTMASVTLSLAAEDECTQVFTSAPLNANSYADGDVGSVAMNLNSISARGVEVAAVGAPIAGGRISRIWIENNSLSPPVGALRHRVGKIKIEAVLASGKRVTVEKDQFGSLIDAGDKIQYCYLGESVAIKTCQSAGGSYNPFDNPKCKFNFTGVSCADPRSCVTGLTAEGNLLCSNRLTTAPTPAPPTQCYCGCTQTVLPYGTCGGIGTAHFAPPGIEDPIGSGNYVLFKNYDWRACIVSSGPPGGC